MEEKEEKFEIYTRIAGKRESEKEEEEECEKKIKREKCSHKILKRAKQTEFTIEAQLRRNMMLNTFGLICQVNFSFSCSLSLFLFRCICEYASTVLPKVLLPVKHYMSSKIDKYNTHSHTCRNYSLRIHLFFFYFV